MGYFELLSLSIDENQFPFLIVGHNSIKVGQKLNLNLKLKRPPRSSPDGPKMDLSACKNHPPPQKKKKETQLL